MYTCADQRSTNRSAVGTCCSRGCGQLLAGSAALGWKIDTFTLTYTCKPYLNLYLYL